MKSLKKLMKIGFVVVYFITLCYAPSAQATTQTEKDGSYVAYDNNTVLDLSTGLMWTQSDNGADISWLEAARLPEGFSLASHHDWRLPTKEELTQLFSKKPNSSGLRISPIFHLESFLLYASDTKTCKAANANLLNASINWDLKSRPNFARVLLVRAPKS